MSELTIVVAIKGREEFTPRFLNHINNKFGVIFAPGGETLADYWAKMLHALERVQTPYAMIADNDDFPLHLGLEKCIDFLNEHPDFVACSGRIQGIYLWPDKLTGPFYKTTDQYSPYDTPACYDQDDINARVLAGFRNSWSYYAVYRTETLLAIRKGVQALDFGDLQVHEKYCAIEALLQGKLFCFETPSLLRQYDTSTRDTNILRDWNLRLQSNDWLWGIDKVIAIAGAQGVDKQALRRAWSKWYLRHLNYHFGYFRIFLRTVKHHMPRLAYIYQHRHELNPYPRRLGRIIQTPRPFQPRRTWLRGKLQNLNFALLGFAIFRIKRRWWQG